MRKRLYLISTIKQYAKDGRHDELHLLWWPLQWFFTKPFKSFRFSALSAVFDKCRRQQRYVCMALCNPNFSQFHCWSEKAKIMKFMSSMSCVSQNLISLRFSTSFYELYGWTILCDLFTHILSWLGNGKNVSDLAAQKEVSVTHNFWKFFLHPVVTAHKIPKVVYHFSHPIEPAVCWFF